MIDIVISGAKGKMGQAVAQSVDAQKGMRVTAGLDLEYKHGDPTIYDDLSKIPEIPDVIVDFSNPSVIKNLTEYAVSKKVALVVGTTGLAAEHKEMLYKASKSVPVFVSHNMCLGVFLILNLAQQTAKILTDHDIEIIEKHHNQKIDAPSGTALMIADGLKEIRQDSEYVFNRADVRQKRAKNEIGIHAIRGGNIVGEHQVLFIGQNETIEITHKLTSRKELADGAVKAAKFIVGKKPGYYTMQDLVNEFCN